MTKKITDYFLYRSRFVIGYTIVAIAALILLAVALFLAPGGISDAEKQSVVTTSSLSFSSINPQAIIDAPYHVLQWLSIRTLGLTPLAIKLPSVIIAILTGIGTIGLLSSWFRRNVAVLAAAIFATTGQFLFLAQYGTPAIMPIFWGSWILFSALMVSRRRQFSTFWKIVLFGSAAISLYTPLSVYLLLAIISAVFVHPHLRYLVRHMSLLKVILALVLSLVLISPLVYAIYIDHSLIKTLLGIPDAMPNLLDNLKLLVREYLSFMSPSMPGLLTPVYGLGTLLLMALGVLRFFSTKYTARGYILAAIILLTIPIMLFDPKSIEMTFLPMALLVALGIDWLFRRWYMLFPVNPYARIAGFIPLSVLLGGIIIASVTRYVGTMAYSSAQVHEFNKDLRIVNHQIKDLKPSHVTLVVSQKDHAFYAVLAKYNHLVTVSTNATPENASPILIARDADVTRPTDHLKRILTDASARDSDRFYLYEK